MSDYLKLLWEYIKVNPLRFEKISEINKFEKENKMKFIETVSIFDMPKYSIRHVQVNSSHSYYLVEVNENE